MTRVIYFAYGSNMFAPRLLARCPRVRVLGPAHAEGVSVAFTKLSVDGSGKAALVEAPGAVAHGVAFELDRDERDSLDAIEGPGYLRQDDFAIVLAEGSGRSGMVRASTYRARRHVEGLLPYDWYRDLIVAGGREHGLPPPYVERLRAAPARPDPDPERRTAREARELLLRHETVRLAALGG